MVKAKQQKRNSTVLYMSDRMCMCRCALFCALSPCRAVSG